MYHIDGLAKMTEVTPNTIRYYEKQQMVEREVRTEDGLRPYTESDLQRLKFIRHARQLGFGLESIRELLSICIDPEHHTCQESENTVRERLREVEARITRLQNMQRSLQRLNGTYRETAHSSAYCSILEALEQGANGVKSGC